MSECHRFQLLIAPYLDGMIQELDRDILTAHIEVCLQCQREVQDYGRVFDGLRAMGPSDSEMRSAIDGLSVRLSEEAVEKSRVSRELQRSPRSLVMTQVAVAAGLLLCFRLAWTFLGGGMESLGPGEFKPSVVWDRVKESLLLPNQSMHLDFEIRPPSSWIGAGK